MKPRSNIGSEEIVPISCYRFVRDWRYSGAECERQHRDDRIADSRTPQSRILFGDEIHRISIAKRIAPRFEITCDRCKIRQQTLIGFSRIGGFHSNSAKTVTTIHEQSRKQSHRGQFRQLPQNCECYKGTSTYLVTSGVLMSTQIV
jgi:hypothetical protein